MWFDRVQLVQLRTSGTSIVEACVARYTRHSYQLCFTLAPRFTNELLLTPNVSTTLRWSSSVVYTTMQYRHTHKYTTTIHQLTILPTLQAPGFASCHHWSVNTILCQELN